MKCSSQALKEKSNFTSSMACLSTDHSNTQGYINMCPTSTSLNSSPCIPLLLTRADNET